MRKLAMRGEICQVSSFRKPYGPNLRLYPSDRYVWDSFYKMGREWSFGNDARIFFTFDWRLGRRKS